MPRLLGMSPRRAIQTPERPIEPRSNDPHTRGHTHTHAPNHSTRLFPPIGPWAIWWRIPRGSPNCSPRGQARRCVKRGCILLGRLQHQRVRISPGLSLHLPHRVPSPAGRWCYVVVVQPGQEIQIPTTNLWSIRASFHPYWTIVPIVCVYVE